MYSPRGFGVSELGDIEVVPDGDDLHLFHLTLPNHDVIQHAVSQDGLGWTPLPAALRTGDPGDLDDDQIWTMSVTPRPSGPGYVMLYTALAVRDEGRVQRVALAVSDDLIRWTKAGHVPVIEADSRWYESDPNTIGAVSWRDPKPTRVGQRYYATVSARQNHGPLPRRGCAGLLVSDDLLHWEVRPPLFSPRRYWDLECPQLFHLERDADASRWYLLASAMEDRSLRYWAADLPDGPFHVPPGGDLLAPPGHYAARVTRWQGRDLLMAWHQPALSRGWLISPETVDWVEPRNPFGKFLAPPLEIAARNDGSLALRSFTGWDRYFAGPWQPARPRSQTTFAKLPTGDPPRWQLETLGAMDLLSAAASAGDVIVEGTLTLNAARGGLALRLAGDGSGLYVEVAPGSRQITLQRWGTRPRDHGRSLALTFAELQCARLRAPLDYGMTIPFRLLSVGPYVEVTLADEVILATMTGNPRVGGWGIWAEDGSTTMSDARMVPMRQPASMAPERHRDQDVLEETSLD